MDSARMAFELALVLGGASSGKSVWAERLVSSLDRPRIYIATSRTQDSEMEAKIAAHRKQRGADWSTLEAPDNLADALATIDPTNAVLVDCATMWLSNRVLDDAKIEEETGALLSAISHCPAPVAIVTNETGLGIVPNTPLGRQFRDLQGKLNQRLAAQADLVVAVMAGLPLALKGELPELAP